MLDLRKFKRRKMLKEEITFHNFRKNMMLLAFKEEQILIQNIFMTQISMPLLTRNIGINIHKSNGKGFNIIHREGLIVKALIFFTC